MENVLTRIKEIKFFKKMIGLYKFTCNLCHCPIF
ncbi:unnamed protein product [Spirodela intermedia]|uniref:Uncharacterized protein n=1 Tax=Spirodela intermedia TaxID=51605 RepID=A0A7I8KX79_SPIIN|nr:unnamed protein product [Spirodela intermedia]